MKKIVSSMVLVSMLMAVSSVVMADGDPEPTPTPPKNQSVFYDDASFGEGIISHSEQKSLGVVKEFEGTTEKTAEDPIPIKVGIDLTGKIATIYDVTAEYDDLVFTYEAVANEYVWNPTTHYYDHDEEKTGTWSAPQTVKVSNHSNADVKVTGSFTSNKVASCEDNGVTITSNSTSTGAQKETGDNKPYYKQLERADIVKRDTAGEATTGTRYGNYGAADYIEYTLTPSGALEIGDSNVLPVEWVPNFNTSIDGYKRTIQWGVFNIYIDAIEKEAYSAPSTT